MQGTETPGPTLEGPSGKKLAQMDWCLEGWEERIEK
jgi:hypothetical protein